MRFWRAGLIAGAMTAAASCATAQVRPPPPPPPVAAPAPAPPPPARAQPPADVRISAPTPVDPVGDILKSEGTVEDRLERLQALATSRFAADDGPGAEAAMSAAVSLAEKSPDVAPTRLARLLGLRTRVRLEFGRYGPALADVDRALALMASAPDADAAEHATLVYDRARVLDALGRNEEAEAAARDSADRRRGLFGPVHEKTADSLNLLANTLTAQGRHAEADPIYRQVLGAYEVLYGPTDFHLAIVLSNLGNSLRRTGRAHQAEPLYLRAVAIAERADDPVLLAQCLTNYGWFLHVTGQGALAQAPFERALELALQVVGPDHPFTGAARANLGYAFSDQGRWAEAEAPFRQGLAVFEAGVGPDSPDLLDTLDGYAAVLDRLERPEEAEGLHERSLAIAAARLPPAHSDGLAATEKYAGFLIRRNRPEEALSHVRPQAAALLGPDGRGRDWRTRVSGARTLFARQVEAAWRAAEPG